MQLSVDQNEELTTLEEFLKANLAPDVEPITIEDVRQLVNLQELDSIYIGNCQITRIY